MGKNKAKIISKLNKIFKNIIKNRIFLDDLRHHAFKQKLKKSDNNL